jgi:hypothetical protein
MKAIHSLWTATPEFRFTKTDAIIHSAAAAFTNRAFQNTELVTDCKGLRIAERLGWGFGSYNLGLQEFCPPHARHVWALGKVAAQSWQTEPFIHIDNDVLVFDPPPRRIYEAALAVQSADEPEGYWQPEVAQVIEDCGLPRGICAYNTGIIAWRDLTACRAYCERAVEIAMKAALKCGDGTVCSLVAEQYGLGAFLRESGAIRPATAIPLASLAAPGDFQDWRFMHAWGSTKREPEWAQRIATRFQNEFPAAYKRAMHGYALMVKKNEP